jgi:dimethylhistidine N-methyltransferase
MTDSSKESRATIITTDSRALADAFAEDVDRGLSADPKYLSCIYLYDYRGSLLFERICNLPEYYLTRKETWILERYSKEIASFMPAGALLVELGSGSCTKAQYVIDELLMRNDRVVYSPIDISRKMLRESATALLDQYDDLEIISIAAEYREGLRRLGDRNGEPKLIIWLGSSIGNFMPSEAAAFLSGIAESMSTGDLLLVGFDMEKESGVLERAYDDAEGVTAEFNLNLLARINRELGGRFDLDRFTHRAVYNREARRMEMYLVSTGRQQVRIDRLGRSYAFREGERVHTENSHKFSAESIDLLARRAGLEPLDRWLDPDGYFSLVLFRPAWVGLVGG